MEKEDLNQRNFEEITHLTQKTESTKQKMVEFAKTNQPFLNQRNPKNRTAKPKDTKKSSQKSLLNFEKV
jgi:hypothetical protein